MFDPDPEATGQAEGDGSPRATARGMVEMVRSRGSAIVCPLACCCSGVRGIRLRGFRSVGDWLCLMGQLVASTATGGEGID